MAFRLLRPIWSTSVVGGIDKLVLLRLADSADDNGENTWPSETTIAESCGIARTTCQRALRSLEAAGVIEKVAPATRSSPAKFRLNLRRIEESQIARKRRGRPPKNLAAERCDLSRNVAAERCEDFERNEEKLAAQRSDGGSGALLGVAAQRSTNQSSTQPDNQPRNISLSGADLFGDAQSPARRPTRRGAERRRQRPAKDNERMTAMLAELAAAYPEGKWVPARDDAEGWRRSADALRSALKADSFENILAGAIAFAARNPDPTYIARPTNWLRKEDWRGELKAAQAPAASKSSMRSVADRNREFMDAKRAELQDSIMRGEL